MNSILDSGSSSSSFSNLPSGSDLGSIIQSSGVLNFIHKYNIPIILLLIAGLLIVTAIKADTNKYVKSKNIKSLRKVDIRSSKIFKIRFIRDMTEELTLRLNVITGNTESAFTMAVSMLVAYFIIAVAIFLSSLVYTRTWYMLVLNVVIAVIVPVMAIRLILKVQLEKIIAQLPRALDELDSAFYNTNKLRKAIELAYPMMPPKIGKAFEMLYFDMLKSELNAIDKFKKMFENEHITSLCVLFKLYMQDGSSDMSRQIQRLNQLVHDDVSTATQSSSKLSKYKLLAVGTLIVMPIFMLMASEISPNVLSYYTSTVEGSNLISLAIVATIVYYILVEIIERL